MCPRYDVKVRHRQKKKHPTLPRVPRRIAQLKIIFQDEYCLQVLEDCLLQRGDMRPSATLQRTLFTIFRIYCFYPCDALLRDLQSSQLTEDQGASISPPRQINVHDFLNMTCPHVQQRHVPTRAAHPLHIAQRRSHVNRRNIMKPVSYIC